MKDQKIKFITDAFSMQPSSYHVVEKPDKWNPKESLKEIKHERVDEESYVYVGYNFDGERIFQYWDKSVNVHYLTSNPK